MKDSERNWVMAIGFIFLLIFIIWFLLFLIPELPGGGGLLNDTNDTDDEVEPTCLVPGLDVTMREDPNERGYTSYSIADIMDASSLLIDEYNITGAEWVEEAGRVGFVIDPEVPMVCRGLEELVRNGSLAGLLWLDYAAGCNRAMGQDICNPGFLGCSCYTQPYTKCAWTMSPHQPDDAKCSGSCLASDETCKSIEDYWCGCVLDEGADEEIHTCYDMQADTCGAGTCPEGETCEYSIMADGCACVQPL